MLRAIVKPPSQFTPARQRWPPHSRRQFIQNDKPCQRPAVQFGNSPMETAPAFYTRARAHRKSER